MESNAPFSYTPRKANAIVCPYFSTAVSLMVAVVLAKALFLLVAFQNDVNSIKMEIAIACGIVLVISTV